MNWIDWILFAVPVAIVVAAAVRAQRYVHGVADFLSAGRIARRYVICVASGEAAFGLVSLVGNLEAHYNSGFRIPTFSALMLAALAWSVFCYSFGWGFCLCFLGNVLWHVLGEMGILPRQPDSWWGVYFFIVNFVVACAVGVVSTFWFGICSTRDLLRLFRDLEERERSGGGLDVTDDGRVRD